MYKLKVDITFEGSICTHARAHTHLINQSNVYSKHETCMENGDHLVTRRIRRIIGRFWTWNLVHESNFHGVLLVINRWSNYSTCRIVGGYFNVARLWCSTTREKKTPLERDRCSQIRWPFANTSLYTLFPISFWTSSRIVLFWIFQLSRKKEGPFFFFGDRSDSIYFNGPRASSCSCHSVKNGIPWNNGPFTLKVSERIILPRRR